MSGAYHGFGQKLGWWKVWPKNFPKLQMRSAGARVARKNASKKGSGAEEAK